ncbi:hypothetical protein SELMODRAFT_99869 [Selaginella moellendorffii]|uniref:Signal peptidase complex subunit 1 n=1 Tax=Selaginella moellendorffii TaxID=88036 RepID=D8RRJ0_SELML|nr:hypothetical protein SELMODRAFT_99869 [Selaginella moellendorffii]
MDWKDPRLTEQILQYTLISSALIAIAAGYLTASLKTMFLVYGGCVFVTLLVIVPDWPYFCRHPREWMTPKRADAPFHHQQQRSSPGLESIRESALDASKRD